MRYSARLSSSLKITDPSTPSGASNSRNDLEFDVLSQQDSPAASFDVDKSGGGQAPENPFFTFIQIFFPFILAGIGMVTAGLVLDKVVEWRVFIDVQELLILVPALLGLKGNLEMTLASRLSTHASMGNLDTRLTASPLILGNLALIQCQSIVVGFLASVVATLMSYFTTGLATMEHFVLMCSSAIITASFASFVLGIVMITVVLASRKFGCNPDNIAAPIAASLGDLTTLGLLACIADATWEYRDGLCDEFAICFWCLIVAPVAAWIVNSNEYVHDVLKSGWVPVLASMCISCSGGLIMDRAIDTFPRMAAFQPVINGAGSNLMAVQASRISTHLHNQYPEGPGPYTDDDDSKTSFSPVSVFCGPSVHTRTARILMLLVVPGQLIFLFMIRQTAADENSVGVPMASLYLLATLLQEWILLYACVHLVHFQWRRSIDPDSAAVPYLAALGDVCGTALLLATFYTLNLWDVEEGVEDPEVAPLNVTALEAKFLFRRVIRW